MKTQYKFRNGIILATSYDNEIRLDEWRDDDGWVTIRGRHVFIENGVITKGPKDLVGKNIANGKVTSRDQGAVTQSVKQPKEGKTKNLFRFKETHAGEFTRKLAEAKQSLVDNGRACDAWRVDTWRKPQDFIDGKTKMYTSNDGSTIAITQDGDIISVCGKYGSKTMGTDLLREAVKRGGRKLDSFEGNWSFYTKNGFEPISRIAFNPSPDIRPNDWDEKRDQPEDIIFFRYNGKKNDIDINEWKSRTPYTTDSEDPYGKAYNERDKVMGK